MEQNAEPVVQSIKPRSKLWIKYRPRLGSIKKISLSIILLVVILAVGFVVYRHIEDNHRVVFTVGSTKYTEGYIDKLIAYPLSKNSSNRAVLTEQAFNYYKKIAVAQKLGLSLNSSEISQLIPNITGPKASALQKDSPWTALLAYDNGIEQELHNPNPSIYSGYAYVFYFAQHIQTGLIQSKLSNMGNAQAIAEDQSYAQTKANYYYKELKTNKMTLAQILTAVTSDPKLCDSYLLDACQSVQFGGSDPSSYTNTLGESPSIETYVGEQNKPGLSPIETGQVANVSSAAEPTSDYTYINAYYYFVDLQSVHKIPNNIAEIFRKDLASLPATYYGWPK